MGRKVTYVCDVTGEDLPEGVKPVTLSWQGATYNLYLSDKGMKKMTDFLDPVLDGAERESNRGSTPTTSSRKTASRPDLPEIRRWAKEQGKDVSDVGRISADVIAEYDAAH
ncbi:histone-like nucleoid-structuring protein Lsr2 [Serinicoccus marinus]|uniref:histone-like nucleoid-structuring protein Lsr2 n=1 Tax=Serinicoccus marinus TaxID=247333 RepID=UPI0009FBDE3E|nr:Lsr2 family protein [Serinicoccus marinus]